MKWREFRRSNLYWKIAQDGETYYTEHGQLGTSNPQTFSDTPGPKGKENTKAYVSAVDNCKFNIEREIRKKTEHGYLELINGKLVEEHVTSIDFNKCLPKNFCSYKPQTSIADSALEKIHSKGLARYTRKYDGMQTVCAKHPWGWEMYTRRMDLTTERFPNHIPELDKFGFNVGTILVGEMVCFSPDGKEDFTRGISRVYRSDPPVSRELIKNGEAPEPTFLIFDILFNAGKSLDKETYDSRRAIYLKAVEESKVNRKLITYVEQFNVTPTNWEKTAKSNGWEGFVITNGSCTYGDKFYSFDGDAKRPNGCHKLKPKYTDEVVVYAAATGTGKRLGRVGSIFVKQIHPETNKYFDCGKVGSGFTDEDIDDFEILCKKNGIPILDDEKLAKKIDLNAKGKLVVEIEFSERQEETNKFRFPVYMRVRDDKAPEECVAQHIKD